MKVRSPSPAVGAAGEIQHHLAEGLIQRRSELAKPVDALAVAQGLQHSMMSAGLIEMMHPMMELLSVDVLVVVRVHAAA